MKKIIAFVFLLSVCVLLIAVDRAYESQVFLLSQPILIALMGLFSWLFNLKRFPTGVVIAQIMAFFVLTLIDRSLVSPGLQIGSYAMAVPYLLINTAVFLYPNKIVPLAENISIFFKPIQNPTRETCLLNFSKAFLITILLGIPAYGVIRRAIHLYMDTFLNGGFPRSIP